MYITPYLREGEMIATSAIASVAVIAPDFLQLRLISITERLTPLSSGLARMVCTCMLHPVHQAWCHIRCIGNLDKGTALGFKKMSKAYCSNTHREDKYILQNTNCRYNFVFKLNGLGMHVCVNTLHVLLLV